MVCGRVRAVLTVTRRVLGRCPHGGAPCERVDRVQTVDEGALKARWVSRSRVVSRQRGCAFAGERLHECKCGSSIGNGRIKLCALKNRPREAYLAAEKNAGTPLRYAEAARREKAELQLICW